MNDEKKAKLPPALDAAARAAIMGATPVVGVGDPRLNRALSDNDIEAEIQAKGLTAPRVTTQRIEQVIAGEYYFTAYQGAFQGLTSGHAPAFDEDTPDALGGLPEALNLLTFCVLVLKNGFTVTGESACASPENFNAELGRKIARQHAVNKIWQLEGYLLRERLHLANSPGAVITPGGVTTWGQR
jgi:hypothetical protein